MRELLQKAKLGVKRGAGWVWERRLRVAALVLGLALVVPAIRIGGNYITGENRTLEIMLELPGGTIKIYGKPVRYNQLDADATDQGYLVGIHIERMSEEDRARFDEYIEEVSSEQ